MCSVDPHNVTTLVNFGTIMFAAGVFSLLTGATYFRCVIRNNEDLFNY